MAKTWKARQPEPARFPSYLVVDDEEKLVALVPIMADNKPTEALALITAAPEMLQTLKTLLADFTSEKTDERLRRGPHVQLLQMTIAKAEGRA